MTARVAQNPDWTVAELVLAYEALARIGDSPISVTDPIITSLSETLNRLSIHAKSRQGDDFRDPGGVRRRLAYLRQVERGDDVSGHQLYKDVVARFYGDPSGLSGAAWAIRVTYMQ